jgi:HK97 family phage major capsid protein
MNVEQLKREKSGLVTEMKSIQAAVEARADKTMTAEERTKFSELRAKAEGVSESIANAEFLAKQEAESVLRSDVKKTEDRAKSFGEIVCRFLRNPAAMATEERAISLTNGPSAGYVVPPEFDSALRSVSPTEAIVRPRASVIPAGSSPDAEFSINEFAQGSDGYYGGVSLNWVGELDERPNAGNVKVNRITFTPYQLVGFCDISKTLLDNSAAIGSFVQENMRRSAIAKEEKSFFNGTGVNQPTGFLGHPSNVRVTRSATGTIQFEDIVNMLAVAIGGNDFVWVAAKSALPTIVGLNDEAGNAIWQPSAVEGLSGTLLGLPLYFSERCPSIGTSGDIALVSLSNYIIKEGSGATLFADPYTKAITNSTRLYFGWALDAKPALSAPIKAEDGIDRSWCVTLED